ncbi:MAG: DNA recombination protein RmuC [Oscillospiraceae bacterium]|nr:DNA recombination protein RmuC [Oscillospiraceae bacterium]
MSFINFVLLLSAAVLALGALIVGILVLVRLSGPPRGQDYTPTLTALSEKAAKQELMTENLRTALLERLSENQRSTGEAFLQNREAAEQQLTKQRQELLGAQGALRNELDSRLDGVMRLIGENLRGILTQQLQGADSMRSETSARLEGIERKLTEAVTGLLQRQQQAEQRQYEAFENIRHSNEEKLEQMRLTVDEKLQKTLETRLGESFRTVQAQLESVHKGLGEMQTLAGKVGDLQNTLSNVKKKGIFGEVQLWHILEDILPPERFAENIVTVPGSGYRVEFAVKLPGKGEGEELYLPIDSKFPTASYDLIQQGYDSGDKALLDAGRQKLTSDIKKFAGDIASKYIAPPHTTDFGILFVPTEGLFAELLQLPGLHEELRRNFKVILAGPTTLAALLNSLQIGFKTLQIERQSAQAWRVLSSVKEEFAKFETSLRKAQERIQSADKDLEALITTRTRAMNRKLDKVELPEEESQLLLVE